ncbi:hypothetical protein TNCV_2800931 [Trichonephila clavipes]|nr:hypothetical protein TNCV_2800931 [Trichonephila clavipes]
MCPPKEIPPQTRKLNDLYISLLRMRQSWKRVPGHLQMKMGLLQLSKLLMCKENNPPLITSSVNIWTSPLQNSPPMARRKWVVAVYKDHVCDGFDARLTLILAFWILQ